MAKNRKVIRRLTTKMRGNLSIVFLGILCLFLLLVIRLIYWNIRDGSKFKTIVLGQQNHTSTTLAYERGKIYDRSGNILAANEKVYTLVLEPKNILKNSTDPEETLEATVEALVKYLNLDEKKLRDVISENENSYYQVYKEEGKELSFEQVEAFRDFLSKKNKKYDEKTPASEKAEIIQARNVSGVMFEESYKRIYPYDSLACRVLGFTSAGNQGNWGIEQEYSDVLNGTDGRSYYYFNEELTQEQTVKEPVNGNSVVSTIDMQIQQIVEDKLKKYDESIGSKDTNILVMDPNTGEILAMAGSHPYNLNDPMNEDNLKGLFSKSEISAMKEYTKKVEKGEKSSEDTAEESRTEAEQSSVGSSEKDKKDKAEDKKKNTEDKEETEDTKKEKEKEKTIYEGFYELWRNAIISDTREPGSTYKPFTVAAGIENGTLKGNEEYSCEGSKTVGKRHIGCSHVHGTISLKDAVAKSCNVAMMNIAYKEGADNFYYYQNQFGFGRKTGIDLPGEADTRSLVYNASNYENDVTLCTNAFGQNFNCSMMQMAAGFASLINGGNYYKPYIVKQIQSDKGDVISDIDKVLVRNTVSEDTSKMLRSYLRETVLSGTGVKAQIPGYSIGGKTGTAEKIPRNKEDYYISFIGFAPVDNPQVMIYVTIDEPNVDDQANAGLAVNLERQCMEKILPLLNIEPTEEITQKDLDAYEQHTGHAYKPDNSGEGESTEESAEEESAQEDSAQEEDSSEEKEDSSEEEKSSEKKEETSEEKKEESSEKKETTTEKEKKSTEKEDN